MSGAKPEPYLIPRIEQPAQTKITLPGSKSIALRQIAMAALTEGDTHITGVPPCDDTDAMLKLVESGPGLYAVKLEGQRYDAGDKLGYLHASLAFALKRPDLREPLRALMSKLLHESA